MHGTKTNWNDGKTAGTGGDVYYDAACADEFTWACVWLDI